MGQCVTKLPEDVIRIPSHSHSLSTFTGSRFADTLNHGAGKPNRHATDESSESFCCGSTAESETQKVCIIQSDRCPESVDCPLLDIRFNRTLFCEDITYEYHVRCNVMQVPEWTVRLTVDQITEFYTETASQWKDPIDAQIPDQFGKVMPPHIFTSLLEKVVTVSGILHHEDPAVNPRAANLLSIPYELRPIVQYNGQQYNASRHEELVFDQFEVSIEDRFKYLCHRTSVYPHDYRYDDCCALYDAPKVECISFWIRSLRKKVDFQFNLLSNNVFTVLMSDAAFIITQAILAATTINESAAWMITDFLPKEIWSKHGDPRCDAEIVYKYDPRGFTPESLRSRPETAEEDDGELVLNKKDHPLLRRHGMSLEEVHSLCVSLRKQCTTTSMARLSTNGSFSCDSQSSRGSISEFIESLHSQTCSDEDQCIGGIPTTAPLLMAGTYTLSTGPSAAGECCTSISVEEEGCGGSPGLSMNSEVDEQYRLFFAAFIDEEEADDINVYQWLESVLKLKLEVTESELVAAFDFMLRQNGDSEGFIDFVDFTAFCRSDISDISTELEGECDCMESVQRAQHVLKTFIDRR